MLTFNMKTSNVTKILAAALAGCLFTGYLGAQGTAPNATVDANGNLVLNPGTAEEQTIPAPSGTVDANGNLLIDGNTITRPTATINANGELDLGDGTILPVPEFPGGGGIEAIFGDTLVALGDTPAGQDGWYFSYNLKYVYLWLQSNPGYAFFENLGSIVYIPDGDATITAGIWIHAFSFPTAGNNTWVYVRSGPGFLEDVRTDIATDIDGGTRSSKKRVQNSYIYIANPAAGADAGWFAYFEGSTLERRYIQRVTPTSGSFIQISPRL